MEEFIVRFQKVRENASVPTYGTNGAAGADLYAALDHDVVIPSGSQASVPTGVAVEIPRGHAGFIFARSGLASRRGLAPVNKVGVIDSDYRGEILVILHNHSAKTQTVAPGERIAQIVFMPVCRASFVESDILTRTERGAGGFGSTGER